MFLDSIVRELNDEITVLTLNKKFNWQKKNTPLTVLFLEQNLILFA